MTLKEQWYKYLEDDERFWKICLKVARAKPYLCAEAVEAEANLIYASLKPKS